jgi:hypothetical protein
MTKPFNLHPIFWNHTNDYSMILVDHTYKICNTNVRLDFIKLQGKFLTTFDAPHLNVLVPTHTFELIDIIWDIPSHVVCCFLFQNL